MRLVPVTRSMILAADAVAVLDHFDVQQAHVIGHSMGGMIGQLLALNFAERVRSLVLLSTSAGPSDEHGPPAHWFVERMSERLFGDRPTTREERISWIVDQQAWFAGPRFGFDRDDDRRTNCPGSGPLLARRIPDTDRRSSTLPGATTDWARSAAQPSSSTGRPTRCIRWHTVRHWPPESLIRAFTSSRTWVMSCPSRSPNNSVTGSSDSSRKPCSLTLMRARPRLPRAQLCMHGRVHSRACTPHIYPMWRSRQVSPSPTSPSASRRTGRQAGDHRRANRTNTDFAELRQGIQLLAGGLAARGFGPGHTLALMSPNIPEFASFFHGAAYAGGTVTTINPTYTAGEIRHQLLDSEATIMVTISMFLDVAREASMARASPRSTRSIRSTGSPRCSIFSPANR